MINSIVGHSGQEFSKVLAKIAIHRGEGGGGGGGGAGEGGAQGRDW